MQLIHGSPTQRVLNAALLLGPALYLLVDILYSVEGWDDGNVATLNMLAAAAYALAVVRLTIFARGMLQGGMVVVAMVGALGSYGVAVNTLHLHYGHADLFDLDGPADAFKMVGFFFPLTLVLGALAVRRVAPFWVQIGLVVGAILFPIAHVGNVGWLAIVDGVVLLAALAGVWSVARAEVPATIAALVDA